VYGKLNFGKNILTITGKKCRTQNYIIKSQLCKYEINSEKLLEKKCTKALTVVTAQSSYWLFLLLYGHFL
jgi:hypothetical protein